MIELSVVKPSPRLRTRQKTSRNIFWQCIATLEVVIFLFALPTYGAGLPAPMSADWGVSTYSFAGAAAAIASSADSFLTNPAGLIYYAGKGSVGGSWLTMPADQTQWSASLIDGSHDLIGGFQFANSDSAGLVKQNYTIDTCYKTPYGVIGASVHAIRFTNSSEGKGWHFTNSIGVLVPVSEGFNLGFYSKSPYDFEEDRYLPPSVHFGAMYTKENSLKATFEAGRRYVVDDQDWYYVAAADILMQEYFAVRGGYRWDHEDGHSFWSLGGALLAPKIEIAGVFIRTTSGRESSGFGFDLAFKF